MNTGHPPQSSAFTGPDVRKAALKAWLEHIPLLELLPNSMRPASSDASFRRYFRVPSATGTTYVAMDAPPDREDCRPFLRVRGILADGGLNVPEVHAHNVEEGFMLISDLGQTTYKERLDDGLDDWEFRGMYKRAVDAIFLMQCVDSRKVAKYAASEMRKELDEFSYWYLTRYHHRKAPEGFAALFDDLIQRVCRPSRLRPVTNLLANSLLISDIHVHVVASSLERSIERRG